MDANRRLSSHSPGDTGCPVPFSFLLSVVSEEPFGRCPFCHPANSVTSLKALIQPFTHLPPDHQDPQIDISFHCMQVLWLIWLCVLLFDMYTFQHEFQKMIIRNYCIRSSVPSWICNGSHWTCGHMPWYPSIWRHCSSSRETQHKQTSRWIVILRENLQTARVSFLFLSAYVQFLHIFPLNGMSAGHFYRAMLCIRCTSHGPVSVCLSQVGVLLKRLNVGSHKQHHTIAQGL